MRNGEVIKFPCGLEATFQYIYPGSVVVSVSLHNKNTGIQTLTIDDVSIPDVEIRLHPHVIPRLIQALQEMQEAVKPDDHEDEEF